MGLWQTVAMQKIRKFPISVDMQQSSTVTCGKSSSSEWALGRCWATIVYFLATCFERFRSTKTLLFRTWDGISIVHTSFHLHFLSLFLSSSLSLSFSLRLSISLANRLLFIALNVSFDHISWWNRSQMFEGLFTLLFVCFYFVIIHNSSNVFSRPSKVSKLWQNYTLPASASLTIGHLGRGPGVYSI